MIKRRSLPYLILILCIIGYDFSAFVINYCYYRSFQTKFATMTYTACCEYVLSHVGTKGAGVYSDHIFISQKKSSVIGLIAFLVIGPNHGCGAAVFYNDNGKCSSSYILVE